MKVCSPIVLLALSCLYGCAALSRSPFEYDYSYKGKFDDYKTYSFFTDLSKSYSDTIDQVIIPSMKNRMEMLGYVYDSIAPDILVAYSIHSHKLEFHTFSQMNIKDWMTSSKQQYDYHEKVYDLKDGTLLIQLIDVRTHTCIWNGYVTDVYERGIFSDKAKLNLVLIQILDQYRIFAKGFFEEKEYLAND